MNNEPTSPDPAPALPAAGLLRRLAAVVYDALLILALLLIATGAFLPFTGGEAVTWDRSPALAVLHRIVALGVIFGFYGLFWTRKGQTLGMASWRMRVERLDGTLPGWGDAARRMAAAALSWLVAGLGWIWVLVDRDHRTWHDILSRTRVVVTPKRSKRPAA